MSTPGSRQRLAVHMERMQVMRLRRQSESFEQKGHDILPPCHEASIHEPNIADGVLYRLPGGPRMSVHQVIAGALNRGENVYAIGSIDGIHFTACAVGSDVVVLAPNFDRVQVIPGSDARDQIVTSVSCCADSGKIAATYGDHIRIFEPTHTISEKAKHNLNYRWFETHTLRARGPVSCVLWSMEGLRLMVVIDKWLILYQHKSICVATTKTNVPVMFCISEEEHREQIEIPEWEEVWSVELAEVPQYIRFSPDGAYFATAGADDRIVKVWYQNTPPLDENMKLPDEISMSFVSLFHPMRVKGFEWRRTGRYMPRKCIFNCILTWCEDNTARIWKETPPPEVTTVDISSDLPNAYYDLIFEKGKSRVRFGGKPFKVKRTKKKIMGKLRNLMSDKKRQKDENGQPQGLKAQLTKSPSFNDTANLLLIPGFTISFHLAATINADTDCLLVPLMEHGPTKQKTFTVHWLNNKELVFSQGAEKLLAEALMNDTDLNGSIAASENGAASMATGSLMTNFNSSSSSSSNQTNTNTIISTASSTSTMNEAGQASPAAPPPIPPPPGTRPLSLAVDGDGHEERVGTPDSDAHNEEIPQLMTTSESISSKDVIDVKLEMLLRQWCKSVDILFTIHPVDGSLVTWTVEWLDDIYRQPSVSFTSRLPNAFPLTDAASLHASLSTFNPHDPLYVDVLRKSSSLQQPELPEKLVERRKMNTILLMTNHDNGSLNLWNLGMDENSLFSTILSITHTSRMCGHRFQISNVVAHPVLPLLLSSSQFAKESHPSESRDSLSEVILWRISPVGPLCKSGGVRELARVAHPNQDAFDYLAWVPTILPSCLLGTVCNSPSSCFVASNGRDLLIYQAVVDARGLLSELFHSDRPQSPHPRCKKLRALAEEGVLTPSAVVDSFKIVSTQSTAKPGCVLEIGSIVGALHQECKVLLMHVFNENLLIDNEPEVDVLEENDGAIGAVVDRTNSVIFSDRFFVVLIEKLENEDVFTMYSLNISSHPAKSVIPSHSPGDVMDDKGFLRPASPVLPSIAHISVESTNVCRQKIHLPDGVRVVSATPAAGHLSSSSLYPACKAPFVLLTSCSDDAVRFWKCVSEENPTGGASYVWREWRMVNDSLPSELEVDGMIYSVSAAHSGRFACAYDSQCQREPTARPGRVEIGVYECESSGGVEWLREDTIVIEDVSFPQLKLPRLEDFSVSSESRSTLDALVTDISARPSQRPPSPSQQFSVAESIRRAVSSHTLRAQHLYENLNFREVVRIDWVSTEDGGHVLTVGVAANIYLYTQVTKDIAQQNIIAMKEAESNLRRPSLRKASSLASQEMPSKNQLTRWVCTRVLELQSADGLPPIPTCLTWARDGLLIVGMQSEMRCYCQWNLAASPIPSIKNGTPAQNQKKKSKFGSTPTLTISPSHSMLEQLSKKGKEQPSAAKNKLIYDIMHRGISKESLNSSEEQVLEAFAAEGLFEASRLANPILPQYHPKQLIVLLNGGRTRRVKAILLHVLRSLKARNVSNPNPLSRAASIRRMSTVESSVDMPSQAKIVQLQMDESLDYDEIDDVAPLPLFALVAADEQTDVPRAERNDDLQPSYDGLFEKPDEDELDVTLADDDESSGGRTRNPSTSSDPTQQRETVVDVMFSAKHNRMLTEMLTHIHLPGLSSVDQMHLLAIADTLSHFSSDIDKLRQANAAMQTARSVLVETGGYATATAGVETVDECGLRFLMAMKQHEYLLLCLPLKQRQQLRMKGLASAHVIWAQHSETEAELLNAVPAMQKANSTWDDLRALGAAWWLKNTNSLRICVEKLAKNAFQQKNDPLDASLFYLSLRKKNVLTHLFKSVKDQKMADFFQQDFNTPHWKKAAAKNAFVLMSKQRFEHAAAFFLLSGSIKDAIQTLITKLNDIQLAMVVVRLFESDPEIQQQMLREILCREVLGQSVEDFEAGRGRADEDASFNKGASKDPFERSMAYWVLKDYSRAAHTLVEEANSLHVGDSRGDNSLSNIFNFYNYLRKHPLVVRQRLTDAGILIGSTEKFLAVARIIESLITPAERRLFFRTAAQHMALGCPMLALDVLARLPNEISMVGETPEELRKALTSEIQGGEAALKHPGAPKAEKPPPKVENPVDWSAPTNVVAKDELSLEWSETDDDEEEDEEAAKKKKAKEEPKDINGLVINGAPEPPQILTDVAPSTSSGIVDIISQHMKFVASLRILTEELSTLASGYEVDGGQLRYQLFHWLEKEVAVLKKMCDYRTDDPDRYLDEEFEEPTANGGDTALHEVIAKDRAILSARYKIAMHRRRWLLSNQKLLRSFTSFCSLHSAQNPRLISALMELLLLLLEIQKDSNNSRLSETLPDLNSFPLLVASVSSSKMFVSSPLAFIENQSCDIMTTISELTIVPRLDGSIRKLFILYNLCQGLASCVYQSLSDVDYYNTPNAFTSAGVLTRRTRSQTMVEEIKVTTSPDKWPGVENVVAFLGREKDEDAPHLRLLLAECFVAISMSLFSFAMAAYDARWLFRLAAHYVDKEQFANVFGGGGEKKLKAAPPARPPRPSVPPAKPDGNSIDNKPQTIRAKLNAKIFRFENQPPPPKRGSDASLSTSAPSPQGREQTVLRWVPPKKNIVQMFAERASHVVNEDLGDDCDSDSEAGSTDGQDHEDDQKEYANPNGYAWVLMRLALVVLQTLRIRQFIVLAGFDLNEIPSIAPRMSAAIKLLEGWAYQLKEELRTYPGGCPSDILPNSTSDPDEPVTAGPSLQKYRVLLEPNNTPFENDGPIAIPVKRLWTYLVRQDKLQNIFITHVFSSQGVQDSSRSSRYDQMSGIDHDSLPEAYKIIQKEHEPIVAFACSHERRGFLVVSTGRELQEMDISAIFDDNASSSWMTNRTDLDVALFGMKRDPTRENDDYQLFTGESTPSKATTAKMMFKRTISGIRRIDSHPTAPYYATGSSDGSIRVWEWGVGQPLYIPRHAGQHAKVTKVTYSANGNKLAATDGDGMVCVWQAGMMAEARSPFFSMKAHSRTANDVRFISHASSLLVTAGDSVGDLNVSLWDTLLPGRTANVFPFVGHTDGATCALYVPGQQTIISGGIHGEVCIWDVRQRALRNTVKAFEPTQSVRALVVDQSNDIIVVGNSDGDIKIFTSEPNPQLMYSLPGEHAAKGGFSFRQVGQATVTGVQQIYVDQQMRMFSCGADCSLNLRLIPSVYNLI